MKITEIKYAAGGAGNIQVFYDETEAIPMIGHEQPEIDAEALVARVVAGETFRYAGNNDENFIIRKWQPGDEEAARALDEGLTWDSALILKDFAKNNDIPLE